MHRRPEWRMPPKRKFLANLPSALLAGNERNFFFVVLSCLAGFLRFFVRERVKWAEPA
jgi:hypothetical protein